MFEALGLILIAIGGAGVALIALYGFLEGRRIHPAASSIRIAPKVLVATADLTPQPAAPRGGRPPATPLTQHDPRLAGDLLAEVFALRADVAAVSTELRNLRQQLEGDAPGDFAASAALRLHSA